MEISETTTQEAIYDRLCVSLQAAAMAEERIRDYRNDHSFPSNEVNFKQFDSITGTELPEYLGKMVGILDLHGPFQSLGRYVRSFGDAEFVVRCLREQILGSMEKTVFPQALEAFEKLIDCCDKIKNITVK